MFKNKSCTNNRVIFVPPIFTLLFIQHEVTLVKLWIILLQFKTRAIDFSIT